LHPKFQIGGPAARVWYINYIIMIYQNYITTMSSIWNNCGQKCAVLQLSPRTLITIFYHKTFLCLWLWRGSLESVRLHFKLCAIESVRLNFKLCAIESVREFQKRKVIRIWQYHLSLLWFETISIWYVILYLMI